MVYFVFFLQSLPESISNLQLRTHSTKCHSTERAARMVLRLRKSSCRGFCPPHACSSVTGFYLPYTSPQARPRDLGDDRELVRMFLALQRLWGKESFSLFLPGAKSNCFHRSRRFSGLFA